MNKPFLILFSGIFLFVCQTYSQQELFGKYQYTGNKITMPYRMHIPEPLEPERKYPLLLYLHGAGERGTDNEITLKNGVLNFVSEQYIAQYPCIILVPQCPKDMRWVEVHWNLPSHTMPEEISLPLQTTMSLLNEIIIHYPVDTNRIYVTGLSMGGFGTWDLISRFPHKFAAAVPVCGGGDTALAALLTQIPIWAFHGAKDKVVLPQRSIDMVNAINKKGGNARLTIYRLVEHNAWLNAYSDERMIQWLFVQTRQRIFEE